MQIINLLNLLDFLVIFFIIFFIIFNRIKTKKLILTGAIIILIDKTLSFFSGLYNLDYFIQNWILFLLLSIGYFFILFGFKGGIK